MNEIGRIKIYAFMLYPYDTKPGQRFRIEQWEPFLAARGIDIDYVSFADEELNAVIPLKGKFLAKIYSLSKAFFRRIGQMKNASKYDVILIYRAMAIAGPAWLEKGCKFLGKPIIFDFDDAIFLTHTAKSNRLFGWAKFAGKTAAICRMSDAVTVGNTYLAEYASEFNDNVSIVPSSVDTVRYIPREHDASQSKIIVGWTGSSTSQTYLEYFNPMLRIVFADRAGVELHVHSDREPDLPGTPYTWHRWTPDNEVDIISTFDVGLMPMPDDIWSQGKCAMKALLYMSLGIPAVCSDLGANREVISNGENGLLCTTTEEWVEAINKLIGDRELRKSLGDAGRRTVEEKYSAEHCGSLFGDAVVSMLDKKELQKAI